MLVVKREGRKIAANSVEQLINPACHDGEIAANRETVTVAIFFPDCTLVKVRDKFIAHVLRCSKVAELQI